MRRERCFVLEGSCLEYLSTPFAPFVDALRKDPAAAHLEDELRRVEAARVASADVERRRRFEWVEKHLRRRAAVEGAILLTIEDLQWCDAASVDRLRFLLARLREAPVLIVTTYRNDDPHAGRAALIGTLARDGATVLELEPLNDRHIAELLRSTAPRSSLSDIDLERIGEIADGRPLVAEELLRAAVDGAIPTSIRSGILERFWALDEMARDVLCTAAVMGGPSMSDCSNASTDGGRAPILATLRKARSLQLIVEGDDALMRFRHAITREILYDELLTAEVRPRHSRAARALEAESPPRLDEAAYHWAAAHDSARAVDANDAAGDRATAI